MDFCLMVMVWYMDHKVVLPVLMDLYLIVQEILIQ